MCKNIDKISPAAAVYPKQDAFARPISHLKEALCSPSNRITSITADAAGSSIYVTTEQEKTEYKICDATDRNMLPLCATLLQLRSTHLNDDPAALQQGYAILMKCHEQLNDTGCSVLSDDVLDVIGAFSNQRDRDALNMASPNRTDRVLEKLKEDSAMATSNINQFIADNSHRTDTTQTARPIKDIIWSAIALSKRPLQHQQKCELQSIIQGCITALNEAFDAKTTDDRECFKHTTLRYILDALNDPKLLSCADEDGNKMVRNHLVRYASQTVAKIDFNKHPSIKIDLLANLSKMLPNNATAAARNPHGIYGEKLALLSTIQTYRSYDPQSWYPPNSVTPAQAAEYDREYGHCTPAEAFKALGQEINDRTRTLSEQISKTHPIDQYSQNLEPKTTRALWRSKPRPGEQQDRNAVEMTETKPTTMGGA